MIDRAELASRGPLLELLPDMGIRRLTHAAIERRFQNVAPVQHGGTLEEMIAGIGDGLLRDSVGFVDVALFMRPRLGHNFVGLMSILRGQLAVPPNTSSGDSSSLLSRVLWAATCAAPAPSIPSRGDDL